MPPLPPAPAEAVADFELSPRIFLGLAFISTIFFSIDFLGVGMAEGFFSVVFGGHDCPDGLARGSAVLTLSIILVVTVINSGLFLSVFEFLGCIKGCDII